MDSSPSPSQLAADSIAQTTNLAQEKSSITLEKGSRALGGSMGFLHQNPVARSLSDFYNAFQTRREVLGLSNPGTVDNIAAELQRGVFLTNLLFSGLRADMTKTSSVNPLFQVSHAFSQGSQAQPPYAFAAIYGSSKIFLQSTLDSDRTLNARFNYRWNPRLVTKTSAQLAPGAAGPGMLSLEHDYSGADFSASLKAVNPWPLDDRLSGIYIASYLQSVTPRLALGLEAVWQRANPADAPQTAISYAARYKGDEWIGSAQLLAQGAVQTSYWRRLTDKVEAGVDLNLQFAGLGGAAGGAGGAMLGGAGAKKEGVATLGAKYDFRMSSFRAQIDSQGKLGCLLEKRVANPVQIVFAGELDHIKNQAKIGLGVSIEAASEDVLAEQEKAQNAPTPPF
ncbi:MAG: translocase of outer mitochondrial membrane [Bathelium mastoideum]|nr:MAG: translocase of outer mitochondrial membrane [Bathelium mastoideum]KAI9687916.1 MAG: translocase of outer mitochondrial membrane [Bathelium mastoideum]